MFWVRPTLRVGEMSKTEKRWKHTDRQIKRDRDETYRQTKGDRVERERERERERKRDRDETYGQTKGERVEREIWVIGREKN